MTYRRTADDPDGVNRRVRQRAGFLRSRDAVSDPDGVMRVMHSRGKNADQGLPRKRISGTNGSWPARGTPPKPPAICALYEDVNDELIPRPIFGQFPRALIGKLIPYLRCRRSQILHICSGCLPRGEGIRVDVRADAQPDIVADGRNLPLPSSSFPAVVIDPPYTPQYAEDLYQVEYPRPSHLLREAERVVKPCGRIAFVHYLVPMPPKRCHLVKILGLSTGFGFPMRAVTIFQKEQDRLL